MVSPKSLRSVLKGVIVDHMLTFLSDISTRSSSRPRRRYLSQYNQRSSSRSANRLSHRHLRGGSQSMLGTVAAHLLTPQLQGKPLHHLLRVNP